MFDLLYILMVVDQTLSYCHYKLNMEHFFLSPMIIFLLLFFPIVDLFLFCSFFFLSIKSFLISTDFNLAFLPFAIICNSLYDIHHVFCGFQPGFNLLHVGLQYCWTYFHNFLVTSSFLFIDPNLLFVRIKYFSNFLFFIFIFIYASCIG